MSTLVGACARLVDATDGQVLAGEDLAAAIDAGRRATGTLPAGPVLLLMPTTLPTVLRYLALRSAGRAVALLDPGIRPEALAVLVERYAPAAVVGVDVAAGDHTVPPGYDLESGTARGPLWVRTGDPAPAPHPDLAVLLTTSGSTGDPKLVRLSTEGLAANTDSIVEALGITSADVVLTALPLHYSYGMSVLHTHLAAGATVVVGDEPLVARGFWTAVDDHRVTTLPLVPSQFAMLKRLRFDASAHPSLRTLTQAGGRMSDDLVREFGARMAEVGGGLFVMYGMTEAGPRMTTLPADRLADKPGSVGPAVPGGRLSIRGDDGIEHTTPGVVGEVVYRGPNVMLGYALDATDLTRGDDLEGVLATGDLGHLDDDGYLSLDGRLSRFAKVFGIRVNLDDVERLFHRAAPVAAVAGDDRVVVVAESEPAEGLEALGREVAGRLRVHWSGIDVRRVAALPLLPNGKVDYRRLEVEP